MWHLTAWHLIHLIAIEVNESLQAMQVETPELGDRGQTESVEGQAEEVKDKEIPAHIDAMDNKTIDDKVSDEYPAKGPDAKDAGKFRFTWFDLWKQTWWHQNNTLLITSAHLRPSAARGMLTQLNWLLDGTDVCLSPMNEWMNWMSSQIEMNNNVLMHTCLKTCIAACSHGNQLCSTFSKNLEWTAKFRSVLFYTLASDVWNPQALESRDHKMCGSLRHNEIFGIFAVWTSFIALQVWITASQRNPRWWVFQYNKTWTTSRNQAAVIIVWNTPQKGPPSL